MVVVVVAALTVAGVALAGVAAGGQDGLNRQTDVENRLHQGAVGQPAGAADVDGSLSPQTQNGSDDGTDGADGTDADAAVERVTPASGNVTVAPGTELLFEVAATDYPGEFVTTRWDVAGETHEPLGPWHDEYQWQGMDFFRTSFDETGTHQVAVTVYDERGDRALGTTEWTVTVDPDANSAPTVDATSPGEELQVSLDDPEAGYPRTLSLNASDADGNLHRAVWILGMEDRHLGSSSLAGARATASMEVDRGCDGCPVAVWVTDERGALTEVWPWTFVATDGSSGDGSSGDGAGDATTHTIEIVSTSSDRAQYEFEVGGDLQAGEKANLQGAEHPDAVAGSTGSGSVAAWGADDYRYSGDLSAIAVDGPVRVLVDGERIDPADYPAPGDASDGDSVDTSELRVVSTAADRAFYEFSVTGDVEFGDAANPEAEYPDSISGAGGEGSVARWGGDTFHVTGDLESVSVDGPAEVYLDGERVDVEDVGSEDGASSDEDASSGEGTGDDSAESGDDSAESDDGSEAAPEPTNGIEIVSTSGDRATYEVTVTSTLEAGEKANLVGADYPDDVSGQTATGSVAAYGADSYRFAGEIESIQIDGPAVVYVNGEQVDPDAVGSAALVPPSELHRIDHGSADA